MNTQSQASRLNYVRVPAMFLQAGFPLKITLYRYAPASEGLKVLHRKGETLDLNEFLEINRTTEALILVVQTELKDLLTQSTTELANYDAIAEFA